MLREIYEKMNGDYDSVIGRLRSDSVVKKFLIKFLNYNYDSLIRDALDKGDYEIAFREAHNLKGICANLSMDALGRSAGELTEALRGGKPEGDISGLLEAMQKDYDMTVEALAVLKAE